MIKTTLGQLRESAPALNELSAQPMPARTSYWLGKLLRKTAPELTALDQQRVALCQRFGVLDPAANRYTFPDPELAADFDRELGALLSTEIEVEGVHTVALDELGPAQLSPGAMAALDWLIVEKQDAPPTA